MESLPVIMIKMYYNSTVGTYFEFRVSSNQTQLLWCPDTFDLRTLKEHIAYMNNNYTDITTSLTVMIDKKNFKMINPILIIDILIIFLLLMISLTIYLKRYSICRTKHEEKQSHSLKDDNIIYEDIDTHPNKPVRSSFDMNPIKTTLG